ncbi:MAG: phosphopantothenate/pantothenate synthetase [Candidatus Helarchaeota archaeon]
MSKEKETEDRYLPKDHPRYLSLHIRHSITKGFDDNVVAKAGLIAHGRGEAFDYLVAERTNEPAMEAIKATAAALLLAKHPVISINGNVAALLPEELVKLSEAVNAQLEINLFYYTPERVDAIRRYLLNAGAEKILGLDPSEQIDIPELTSLRRHVDPNGIYIADLIMVPLEDGDRTEALKKFGKKVIAIDLNPLSRTAQWADITIVDNIVRCIPLVIKKVEEFKVRDEKFLQEIVDKFNNKENLKKMIAFMGEYLRDIAEKGIYIPEAAAVFKEMGDDE